MIDFKLKNLISYMQVSAMFRKLQHLSGTKKLTLAVLAFLLVIILPVILLNLGEQQITTQQAAAGNVSGALVKWYPLDIRFTGPSLTESSNSPNPFLDYRLQATFTSPSGKSYVVPGFFDGDGNGGGSGNIWTVRFSPDESGAWTYVASFRSGANISISTSPSAGTPASFDGSSGSFTISNRNPNAPGFLKWGWLEYVGGHYLKFRDGSYWVKGGADSPENFLGYAGFDNTPNANHSYPSHASDWQSGNPVFNTNSADGGKGLIGAVNYLASKNINSVYFLPMNIGGDGQDTSPYVSVDDWFGSNTNDNSHFDISKLAQWEKAFRYMQEKGIHLHFVLNEAEGQNKRELDDATLGTERKLFYRELVARFGHHNALQWNISEEYDFDYPLSPQTVVGFANYIRSIDPYKHPVTIHQIVDPSVSWNYFLSLGGNNPFDLTAFQYHSQTAANGDEVEKWRNNTTQAGKPLVISLDELRSTTTGNADAQRKDILWPTYLSGGQLEWYVQSEDANLENFRDYDALWTYTGYARTFMDDNLPFWEMEPDDNLLSGASNHQVLYKQNAVYAIYLPSANSTGTLDLSGTSGAFQKRWYNPRTGNFEGTTTNVSGGGSHTLGSPPNTASEDWVVLLKNTSLPSSTPTPTSDPIQLTPTPTPSNLGNGDANADGSVNNTDLTYVLQNWLAVLTTSVDQYNDGLINALDFVRVIKLLP